MCMWLKLGYIQTLIVQQRRKRFVGKIADEIRKIQVKENLTLPEVFEKYPHMATLQYKELKEEANIVEEKSKQKELLFD